MTPSGSSLGEDRLCMPPWRTSPGVHQGRGFLAMTRWLLRPFWIR